MFDVLVGIPVPPAVKVGRPRITYPFADMAVGGSFFVPIGESDSKAVMNRLRTATRRWRIESGSDYMEFRIAVAKHNTEIGVWRVL